MPAKINLLTGKIIGAKKGSFEWWHEKAHQKYDNSPSGITNSYYQQMFFTLSVTFIIISSVFYYFWYFSFLSIIIYWFYFFYEEFWCNKEAKNKLKEVKNV